MESLKKALHMALNKEVFKTRTQTAVLYVVVMLTGLLWNTWSFFILFSIVHFGCWHEYLKLIGKVDSSFDSSHWFHRYYYPLLGFLMMLAASAGSLMIGDFDLSEWGMMGFRVLILLIFIQFFGVKRAATSHYVRLIAGLLYISVPFALFINLRSGWIWGFEPGQSGIFSSLSAFDGKLVSLVLVATIWINDTMAYIVGSFIGKTPLSKWSPKKTWEGTLGGIILSIALISSFGWFYGAKGVEWIFVTSVVAIAGTFGDLLESRLKRMAGVKDSGSFMPGHGGFLDRFDSIILAVPAVWITCYLLYR
jgi:phosphatidate cytidylyltransferase